eukprot:scaffold5230_cov55-Phaeocystis_antarctica.AAC.3
MHGMVERCQGPVTHGRVGSRWQGSRLERFEGRVALEDLDERHAGRGAEFVAVEAAQTAKEGEQGKRSERACCCGRDAWAGGFDGRAADLSDVRVVLLLSASAIAMPPAGPSSLQRRLRTRQRKVNRASAASVACLRSPCCKNANPCHLRCRHQLAARGSQLVPAQVQLGDLVALHRREERAHVHWAEHLHAEVHCLAARRLALELDQRGAVRLDHLVLQARDQRLVVRVGERTAARHVALVCHLDLRVAVEGA